MFDRIATGWELAKQSMRVLRLDKELLLFPVFSGVACTLVMLSFGLPIFFSGMLETTGEELSTAQSILWFVIAFAFYFVNYFVIIFFNSALIGCAIIRLKGGDPIVSDGIGAAMARLPQIAGWALVSATVGMIVKAIESRSEKVGAIVANLIGMAWSIITFFVVPVLVVEKVGPIEAVKRSASIMKNTWGEALVARFGIGIIAFFASLIAFIPIGFGAYLISTGAMAFGIALIVIGVLFLLATSLVTTTLQSIIVAALYIYAAEGQPPQVFDSSLLKSAFGSKN